MKYLLFILTLYGPLSQAKDVVLPGKTRDDYFATLLSQALSYNGKHAYKVRFIEQDIPKLRAFKLIANNQGLDIIAAGATHERQALLRPIRIPLLKGLNGWRIALVREESQDLFQQHTDWASFQRLLAGQLLTWSDAKILEHNGVALVKGSNFAGLFRMLEKQRFDYFPRSILEIENEYQAHKRHGLIVEPHVVLHYPTAYYFYVHKDNTKLASDIEAGLEMAIADGQFDRIFNRYYGDVLKFAKLHQRRIIELQNPLLPDDAPLSRKELWLTQLSVSDQP